MSVTIQEVAEAAGVSKATVSKVLHVGKKTPPGITVIQPLLLWHIAKNAAEGDTRCGLTTPEDFTGVRSKSACDDVN